MYTKLCTKALWHPCAQLLLYVYNYAHGQNLCWREYSQEDICSWYAVPSLEAAHQVYCCVCASGATYQIVSINDMFNRGRGKRKKKKLVCQASVCMCIWKRISIAYIFVCMPQLLWCTPNKVYHIIIIELIHASAYGLSSFDVHRKFGEQKWSISH